MGDRRLPIRLFVQECFSHAPGGSNSQGKEIKSRYSLEILVSANFIKAPPRRERLISCWELTLYFSSLLLSLCGLLVCFFLFPLRMLFLEGGLTRDISQCLVIGPQPTPFPVWLLSRHLLLLPCSRVCRAPLPAHNHHLLRLPSTTPPQLQLSPLPSICHRVCIILSP